MNGSLCWAGCVGLLGVLACSGVTASQAARAPAIAPLAYVANNDSVHRSPIPSPSPTLEYSESRESDRVFIENAERAIGQYSEFIARAGEREEYAAAVERSRAQIEDLRAAIAFVRSGSDRP